MLRLDRVMEDPLTQCILFPPAQQVCRTLWQDNGAFSLAGFGFAGAVFSLALIVQGSGDFQCTFLFVEVLPLQAADLAAAQAGGQFRIEEIVPGFVRSVGFLWIRCSFFATFIAR